MRHPTAGRTNGAVASTAIAYTVPRRRFAKNTAGWLQPTWQLRDGEAVRQWLRMWQEQVDEEGRSVTRSFGLPTTDVEYYTYNKGNNPQGTYRIGVFDSQGHPTPPPPKLVAKT